MKKITGSLWMLAMLTPSWKSPFAVETAHIKFKNSDLSARIYRSLFDTARQYRESKRRRLAGPGLGDAEKIAALQQRGDGLGLDGGGFSVTRAIESAQ